MDGLIKQISELASPGSRICMDMVDKAYMDGTVKNRGYSCGSEVRCYQACIASGTTLLPSTIQTWGYP